MKKDVRESSDQERRIKPPSALALAIVASPSGFLTMTFTLSECPSRLARKGFANIRSSLAATRALLRSLGLANGCMRGSRFLDTGVGLPGRAGVYRDAS